MCSSDLAGAFKRQSAGLAATQRGTRIGDRDELQQLFARAEYAASAKAPNAGILNQQFSAALSKSRMGDIDDTIRLGRAEQERARALETSRVAMDGITEQSSKQAQLTERTGMLLADQIVDPAQKYQQTVALTNEYQNKQNAILDEQANNQDTIATLSAEQAATEWEKVRAKEDEYIAARGLTQSGIPLTQAQARDELLQNSPSYREQFNIANRAEETAFGNIDAANQAHIVANRAKSQLADQTEAEQRNAENLSRIEKDAIATQIRIAEYRRLGANKIASLQADIETSDVAKTVAEARRGQARARQDATIAELSQRVGKPKAAGGITQEEYSAGLLQAQSQKEREIKLIDAQEKLAKFEAAQRGNASVLSLFESLPGTSKAALARKRIATTFANINALPEGFKFQRGILENQELGEAVGFLGEVGDWNFSVSRNARDARRARRQVERGRRRIANMEAQDAFDARHGVHYNDPDYASARRQAEGGSGNIVGNAADRMLQAANLFLQAAGMMGARGGNARSRLTALDVN